MEYALIITLQLLGIGFHVMQKVVSIGDKYTDISPYAVFKVFWKEDWDTLAVSSLVLFLNVVVHFVLINYVPPLPFVQWEYFLLVSYGAALLFGYAGQRMIYKYFGTAEKFLDKQVNDRIN